jgi:outer membrane protein G
MKKIIFITMLAFAGFVNAQAYKGKGDIKGQVGLNVQKGGTGITVSSDFGIGENMSYGFTTTYLLNAKGYDFDETAFLIANPSFDPIINGTLPGDSKAKFEDRFDLKARFNANLGNVFKLDSKMDIYPGLDLGLRNFGAHIGLRYFFTDGFGLYAEAGFPLARYNTKVDDLGTYSGYYKNNPKLYNNQFVLNIGASFNL